MIQWIDPTLTLGKFLEKSLKNQNINQNIFEKYSKWLPLPKNSLKYNRNKVITFYRSIVHEIPMDIMR